MDGVARRYPGDDVRATGFGLVTIGGIIWIEDGGVHAVKRVGVNAFTAHSKAVVGERSTPLGEPIGWDPTT